MTTLALSGLVVSPVHVGDGTTWTPETFKLDGDTLVRFEPAAVLAGLAATERGRFVAAVNAGNLDGAQTLLHNGVTQRHALERIAISAESHGDVAIAIGNPARAGRVHPFIRSGGRPFLPGSAVKGALRTAVLSARLGPQRERWHREIASATVPRGAYGSLSDRLQRDVLGHDETDTDPFRFVRVGDATVDESATRVERVFNRKRDGSNNRMQMHFESLLPGTRFEFELAVEPDAAARAQRHDSAKAPRAAIALQELIDAANGFYRGRWEAERQRFYAQERMPDPAGPGVGGWPLLLRVGRFSHFESASVDGVRRGWQATPAPGRPIAEGSTRAVVMLGGRPVPFGWVLLVPRARAGELDAFARQVPWLGAVAAPAPRAQAAPALARPGQGASLQGRRGFVYGEPAVVVADRGDRLDVEFTDSGEREEVARGAFKPER